jgi:hypothetical protein
MNKFFTDLLTQNDNQTWCIARVGVFIGIITFVCLGFIHTIYNHTMDFSGFGMGLGGLLGGAGVYIGSQAATDKETT